LLYRLAFPELYRAVRAAYMLRRSAAAKYLN